MGKKIIGLFITAMLIPAFLSAINLELKREIETGSLTGQPGSISANSFGEIFLTDQAGNKIIKLDVTGRVINELGGFGWNKDEFNGPAQIHCHGLDLYVADQGNHRIIRLNRKLHWLTEYNLDEGFYPEYLWVNKHKYLFFTSKHSKSLFILNPEGKIEEYRLEDKVSVPGPALIGDPNGGGVFLQDPVTGKVYSFNQFGGYLGQMSPALKGANTLFSCYKQSLVFYDPDSRSIIFYELEKSRFSEYSYEFPFPVLDIASEAGMLYVLSNDYLYIFEIGQ
ncbi:hypothetical protein JW877_10685 [bacterium]|nr:hypothetical protein [bacterium]